MRTVLITALSLAFMMSAQPGEAGEPQRKPNVIILLADDLGYGDIGVHGAKDVATPHIDSLAKHGVRCTSGYVTGTVCSPTRAGLLTGRYQQRFGHEFNPTLVRHGGMGQGLPVGERTIADWLKAAGYVTGLVGKWHLGEDEQFQPPRRGFDEFFGFLTGAHGYFTSADKNYGPIVRSTKSKSLAPVELPAGEDAYLTRVLAGEACGFIQRHRERPFFLYLAFNAVHTPMHAPNKTLAGFAAEKDETRRTYLAMVKELDDAVGRVLAKLRELALEEDTLVFFLGDNGGPTTKFAANGSRNGLLRGSKGDTWEGGIRVPYLVRWKGKLPAGKTFPHPVSSLDILPTALAACGDLKSVRASAKTPRLDGLNLLEVLGGAGKGEVGEGGAAPGKIRLGSPELGFAERALFWRFGTQMAIRKGDWVLTRPSTGTKEYEAIAAKPMLFNVTEDIGQEHDLTALRPEIARALQAQWDRWNADLPAPAWPATLRGKVFTMP
jgi:arylsulfatase A-like enzyme